MGACIAEARRFRRFSTFAAALKVADSWEISWICVAWTDTYRKRVGCACGDGDGNMEARRRIIARWWREKGRKLVRWA
jgi:aminoglycoside phosphotransferase (APT) family kinase protein